MAVRTHEVVLDGGLDLLTPVLQIGEGRVIDTKNYELRHNGGYRRVDGYEPCDGRPNPNTATYFALPFDNGDFDIEPHAGSVFNQNNTDGVGTLLTVVLESGSYAAQDAAGYITVYSPSGTFDAINNIWVPSANMVVNGTFDTATDWTPGSGWTIPTPVATGTAASGNLEQTAANTLVLGTNYRVVYTISNYVGGDVTMVLGGNSGTARSANGTFTEDINIATLTDQLISLQPGAAFTGDIDDIEVYEYFFYTTALMEEKDATFPADHDEALARAADQLRIPIAAVPGEGPVRGVWMYNGVKYAFRNNVGSTEGTMWSSTAAGWVQETFGERLGFTSGGAAELLEGETIDQGGTSAIVRRIVLQSGTWAGGTAAGYLVISDRTGGNFSAAAVDQNGGQVDILTADGIQTAITLPAGGRYEFVNENFTGHTSSRRMYFVNGVGFAHEWDGAYLVPIETGMTIDTPAHIAVHKLHLFLSFDGGSLQHSAVGDPVLWSVILGAAELGLGVDIVALEPLSAVSQSDAMAVIGRNRTKILYGASVSDWDLRNFYKDRGAIEWTTQHMAKPTYLDDRGVTELDSSDKFVNFEAGTISSDVETFITPRKDNAVASTIARYKNQYRLYFDASEGGGAGQLITNGGFDADVSSWTEQVGNVTWNAGRMQLANFGATITEARQQILTPFREELTLFIDFVSSNSNDRMEVLIGTSAGGSQLATGSWDNPTTGVQSVAFTPTQDDTYITITGRDTVSDAHSILVDDVSVVDNTEGTPLTEFLHATYSDEGIRGFMIGKYPIKIECASSLDESDTLAGERILVGAADGFVYELDSGRTFGGEDIEAYLRLSFTHIRNPRRIKRFRGCEFDMIAGPAAMIRVIPELDYGDPDQPGHEERDASILGGGGAWDVANWQEFYWSQLISSGTIPIDGSGVNLSLVFYSLTDQEEPHSINGIVYNYSERRLKRAS